MTWGSISLFGGFLENKNSLEALIVIFDVSSKGSFWLKMKYFEISVLTANSRYLQTANVFHVFKSSDKLFQILALPSSPSIF